MTTTTKTLPGTLTLDALHEAAAEMKQLPLAPVLFEAPWMTGALKRKGSDDVLVGYAVLDALRSEANRNENYTFQISMLTGKRHFNGMRIVNLADAVAGSDIALRDRAKRLLDLSIPAETIEDVSKLRPS